MSGQLHTTEPWSSPSASGPPSGSSLLFSGSATHSHSGTVLRPASLFSLPPPRPQALVSTPDCLHTSAPHQQPEGLNYFLNFDILSDLQKQCKQLPYSPHPNSPMLTSCPSALSSQAPKIMRVNCRHGVLCEGLRGAGHGAEPGHCLDPYSPEARDTQFQRQ